LLTRIVTMESVSLSESDEKLTAFLELESAIQRDVSAWANRMKVTGEALESDETSVLVQASAWE
jgi:hypothetical protein